MLRTVGLVWVTSVTSLATVASAQDGNESSSTINASTTVVQAISVEANQELNFGSFFSPDGLVTVVADPADTQTSTNNGIDFFGTNTPQAASVTVTGEPDLAFSIGFSPDFMISGPSGDISVSGLSALQPGMTAFNVGTLAPGEDDSNGGEATVFIGGSLLVPGDILPGSYSGSFDVTVTYQ